MIRAAAAEAPAPLLEMVTVFTARLAVPGWSGRGETGTGGILPDRLRSVTRKLPAMQGSAERW